MQLTKDDVEWINGMKLIPLSKFLKVKEFYNTYKDGKNQPPTKLWKKYIKYHLEHSDIFWNDFLFKHCFEDGLKDLKLEGEICKN